MLRSWFGEKGMKPGSGAGRGGGLRVVRGVALGPLLQGRAAGRERGSGGRAGGGGDPSFHARFRPWEAGWPSPDVETPESMGLGARAVSNPVRGAKIT